jgi:prephenate dehydrogenase
MQSFVFRSRALILASGMPELVRDICCDIPKAQNKLRSIQEHLKCVREMAAAEIAELSAADVKLTEAINVALLITEGRR